MDWLRSCYRGAWRLWEDGPLIGGRYYFSPAGTPFLEKEHYFTSKNWLSPHERGPLGDQTSRAIYDKGSPPHILPAPRKDEGRCVPALDVRPLVGEAGAYGHAASCFGRPVITHDPAKWKVGLRLSVAAFTSSSAGFSWGLQAASAPTSTPPATLAMGVGAAGVSAVPAVFSWGLQAASAPTSAPPATLAMGVGVGGAEATADFAAVALGIRTGDAPHNSAATLAVGVFVEGGA